MRTNIWIGLAIALLAATSVTSAQEADTPAKPISAEYSFESNLPKLMLTVTPGFILGPERAQWCKDNLKNLETVHLGPGAHFIQEQYPHEIGEAIAKWYQKL